MTITYHMGTEGRTWTIERPKLRGTGWTLIYTGSKAKCMEAALADSEAIAKRTGQTVTSLFFEV